MTTDGRQEHERWAEIEVEYGERQPDGNGEKQRHRGVASTQSGPRPHNHGHDLCRDLPEDEPAQHRAYHRGTCVA